MRQRISLVVAVVAGAVVLGLLIGLWLSSNAPVERVVETPTPAAQALPGEAPIAAADTAAYVPEPPQPRVDGSRGVPARRVAATQPVPMVSALQNSDSEVVLSTVAPDLLELREQYTERAEAVGNPPPAPVVTTQPPSSSVVTVDLPGTSQSGVAGGTPGMQAPLTQAQGPQNGGDVANAAAPEGWIRALRADLAQCATQGALSRVFCNEQARWRHCGPNSGWGKVAECPGTGNN